MDLKNLLNESQGRIPEISDQRTQMETDPQIKTEDVNQPVTTTQPKVPPMPFYNYDYQSILNKPPYNTPLNNLSPTNINPSNLNLPFMQPYRQTTFPQHPEPNPRTGLRNDWPKNAPPSNGVPPKQFEQIPGNTQFKPQQQQQQPTEKPRNGHAATPEPETSRQGARTSTSSTSYEALVALRTIEKYKANDIKNELPIREGGDWLSADFPESPFLLASDAYETTNGWSANWKPEQVEKIYPDVLIRDQKGAKDLKKTIKDFRRHVDSLPAEDEIWCGKDLPLMHLLSCLNSKKNRNCMGCSPFWKSVQTVQDEIRPWGTADLLHYEPEHSETFVGHITMNGSFTAQTISPLSTDYINTMYYSDDPNAIAIWGFVSPNDVHKLTEDDSLGLSLFDQKNLIDPSVFEKKVKVIYGVQKVGQTTVVPANWVYWVVRMGRGLSFSASWQMLRLKHIANSRRATEFNRVVGVFRHINVASLIVSAAYQKLDELECVETSNEKQQICNFLLKILPILKTLVLEEILGEPLPLSAMVVLTYDLIVNKYAPEGKRSIDIPSALTSELGQVAELPLSILDNDVLDDEEDVQFSCNQCKYILFNTRRSCNTCKGYDLCEPCYNKFGRKHNHKMKRHRKIAVQTLLDLVESIRLVLAEHEQDEQKEARTSRKRDREKREFAKQDEEPSANNDASYDEEVIDCICGNNKDLGFMISCEKCYSWLHGKCVGISKRNEPEVYYCPRCVKKGPIAINAKLSPKDVSPEEKLREYGFV